MDVQFDANLEKKRICKRDISLQNPCDPVKGKKKGENSVELYKRREYRKILRRFATYLHILYICVYF